MTMKPELPERELFPEMREVSKQGDQFLGKGRVTRGLVPRNPRGK